MRTAPQPTPSPTDCAFRPSACDVCEPRPQISETLRISQASFLARRGCGTRPRQRANDPKGRVGQLHSRRGACGRTPRGCDIPREGRPSARRARRSRLGWAWMRCGFSCIGQVAAAVMVAVAVVIRLRRSHGASTEATRRRNLSQKNGRDSIRRRASRRLSSSPRPCPRLPARRRSPRGPCAPPRTRRSPGGR